MAYDKRLDGRTVDELRPMEAKAGVTRMGMGSKIVLTGHVGQIVSSFVDGTSNGLTYTVESWRDSETAGHITLVTSERSDLAEEAGIRM